MQIILHDSAAEFLARVEPILEDREREHHLLLGVAHSHPAATFVTIESGDGLRLAVVLSRVRPVIVSAVVPDSAAAIDALVDWIAAQGHRPPGFVADIAHAQEFARAWLRLYGKAPTLKMRQRLHALAAVEPAPHRPGRLRRATESDIDLLTRWQGAFNREAMGDALDPELRDALVKRVGQGQMYLWVDGEPRSMAASARPTRHGVAINSVYTPPEHRGHGYATACVSSLSQELLASGKKFCVLYTDLANPTSNAIYARIGYRPVSDSLMYEIDPPSPNS